MNPYSTSAHSETVNPAASLSGGHAGRSPEPAGQRISKYRLAPDQAVAIRTTPPICMSVMECAAYLGISPRKVRDLVTNRDLRSVRIGSRIIVKREWADDFLDA